MLERFAQAFAAADVAAVAGTMTEDVTLRVAVHEAPFEGRPATTDILGMVFDGVLHDIEVTETIAGDDGAAVLMFTARVASHPGRADGLFVVRSDPGGRIDDLTVFLRPLAALQALADEMGRRFDTPLPEGGA